RRLPRAMRNRQSAWRASTRTTRSRRRSLPTTGRPTFRPGKTALLGAVAELVVLGRPGLAIVAQEIEDRVAGTPLLGQGVLHAWRDLAVLPPGDHAGRRQVAQAPGENAWTHPGRFLQLVEPAATVGQIVHDQQRPVVTEELGSARDRASAGARLLCLGHA